MELESELFWGYALFSNSKWWILVFWHIELQINPILEVTKVFQVFLLSKIVEESSKIFFKDKKISI